MKVLVGISLLLVFLLQGCNHLLYHPDKFLHYPPQDSGLAPEEITFNSGDGTKLYGWFFKVKGKAKGTIVQFHGNGQNMTSHYMSLAWLIERGYNLFSFDYRGYGVSEGKPSHNGLYLDGLAALDKAWELHRKNMHLNGKGVFIIYGQSLGGAVAMRTLLDFKKKDQVDLFVADSSFLSYQRVARRILGKQWFLWPFSWISYLAISDEFAPEKTLLNSKTRFLVIHDEQDPLVSFTNGKEIFEILNTQKEFWKFNQRRHTGAFFGKANEYYRDKFAGLLENIKAESH